MSLAHQVKKGHQALVEKGGHLATLVLKVSLGAAVTQVCQVHVASLEQLAWPVARVKTVNQASMVFQENVVLLVHKVLWDKEAYLESLAETVTLDRMACLDAMDPQEAKVTVVKVALLELQDLLVTLGLQETMVPLEKLVKEDFRVHLALLALLVLLVLVVLLVLKVLVVIKVKLVNEAAQASRVIEDFLVPLVSLVLLVPWVHKVQLEVQELQVQGVPQDQLGPLEKMVQAAIQVQLVLLAPVVTEVKVALQVHQANLVFLGLLVLLVHVVVVV